MTKKFWQTESFRQIEAHWREKLQESGFIDIESTAGKLKQNAANSYRTTIAEVIDGKLRYFELLGQGLNSENDFKDELEKHIIQRRAEGFKIEEISSELKSYGLTRKTHRQYIRRVIQFYERKWKIKRP